MKFNEHGYYISTPFHYEDWHAGVKIERLNYLAFYFNNEGILYRKGKTNTTIYTKDDFIKSGAKGEYTLANNIIEYVFKKGQEFEIRRQLTILGLNLFSDQDKDEYRWTPFPTKEENDKNTPSQKIDS